MNDKYYKMCNVKEIQNRWKPRIGDHVVCSQGYYGILTSDKPQHITYPDGNEGEAYVGISPINGHSWSSRHPVWLPTWAQLMEMFRGIYPYNEAAPVDELYLIYDVIKSSAVEYMNYDPAISPSYWKQFKTHEQLLLAVIMLLKYKKYFDEGKCEWVQLKWKENM